MSEQHDIICRIKDIAIDLGRTPTRDEFVKFVPRSKIDIHFGSYAVLVSAAGLDQNRQVKVDNSIFNKNISDVISSHKEKPPEEPIRYEPTLIIGDTHFPFASKRVLEAIYNFAQKNKPSRIIQVGDLYDLYAHSKFPRSQNIYGPQQEEELAIEKAAEMWKTLKAISPKADCIQLKGNHDVRPVKRVLESLPSLEHVVERHLNSIMTFDGVKLISDHREEYIFNDVAVIHGHYSRLGQHRDYSLMNTIHGHTHKMGIVYRRVQNKVIWELDVGFVGDYESKVFSYTAQKMTADTQGFGWIDEYGPRAIIV